MTTKVRDESYLEISERSYELEPKKKFSIFYKNGNETWELEDSESNGLTGFDASVYKKGNEIVVAFRGTEGSDPLGRGNKDIQTDITYIASGQKPGEMPNQFTESLEYVRQVKKKFPDAKISMTGHSLGGALASYVAAIEDMDAVTFNAPSVVDILPDEAKERVLKGLLDKKVVNYIHPRDSIGAGAVEPYSRHIGSSFYVGSRYYVENAEQLHNPLGRFLDSALPWNSDFHGLQNFDFDENGNLVAPVITNSLTVEELYQSPRFGAGGGETIKMTPELILVYADELNKRTGVLSEYFLRCQESLLSYNHLSETSYVKESVLMSTNDFYTWYMEENWALEDALTKTAKEMKEADKLK